MQFGRTKIYTDAVSITPDNIAEVLQKAMSKHVANRNDIDYLYKYYKGNQPVLNRIKEIRPEINNKIVENRAYEFVDFKTGYMLDGMIQYISRSEKENVTLDVGKLNDLMALCDKETGDSDLLEWLYIGGVAPRLILANNAVIDSVIVPTLLNREVPFYEDEAPFRLFTLDPRNAFVVYSSQVDEHPMMAVKYVKRNGNNIYSVWTQDGYYELEDQLMNYQVLTLGKRQVNSLGYVPIIEYTLNNARMGIVEVVDSITDAINTVQSNRLDGVEQFVQSLLVLYNAEIDEDAAHNLREAGLIMLKSFGDNKADIKELVSELNQQQTQTLVDYMYHTMLNIVGMPNTSSTGGSTSDTGAATLVRDGWEACERRAKKDEKRFKSAERQLLKIVLRIVRDTIGTSLTLADIDIKFPARSYKNKSAMAAMLVSMLSCEKIHPLLAFTECEMFDDPQAAYQLSMDYYEKNKADSTNAVANAESELADNFGGIANSGAVDESRIGA